MFASLKLKVIQKMKNKKIFFCIVVTFFLSLLCSYIFCDEGNSLPEKENVLDKLKDPKQYIEQNNEKMKQEKEGESSSPLPQKNTASPNNGWFLFHQKIWDTEQSSIIEGEETSPSTKISSTESSWVYYFFRTIIALIFVVGLILVFLGGLRYLSQKGHKGIKSIGKVIGILYLSPKARIYYVQSMGKVFVLGISGDRMSLLFTVPEEDFFASVSNEEVLEPSLTQKNFNKVLDEVESRIQSRVSSEKENFIDNADDELASLKVDIQRLQQVIREEKSDSTKK